MVKCRTYATVPISLSGHHYSITVGQRILHDLQYLQSLIKGSQVLIVSNQTIAPLYLHFLMQAFVNFQCDVVVLEDGEHHKTQENLFVILDTLAKNKHHRDTTLIALGGGVVGDLTGFAASIYQRGVYFVQIPTSLLAQVDASVGGKTAINHVAGKNLIGSFYQPHAVFMDLEVLQTLPLREFRSGLAEVIKYALLAGGEFLEFVLQALAEGIDCQSVFLTRLILDCCQIKAFYVQADEKEKNLRALLNLGHTFAHALENYFNYQGLLHGEAVAIGLYCASLLSQEMGFLSQQDVLQVKNMLLQAGLPYQIPSTIELDKLRELMNLDKKIEKNKLRFVLIRKFGDCYLENQVSEAVLHRTLDAAMAGD